MATHDSQSSLSGDTGRGDPDRALTLRSIRTLVDVLTGSVDLSKLRCEESERFMSLIGGLADQLEESESTARRNESEGSGATGAKVKPPQQDLGAQVAALLTQHDAAIGALRRMRASFRTLADERDALKTQNEKFRAALVKIFRVPGAVDTRELNELLSDDAGFGQAQKKPEPPPLPTVARIGNAFGSRTVIRLGTGGGK